MKTPDNQLNIEGHIISRNHPTYFIADIAANHDGDLDRARALIRLAKDAGADAAKFQHFRAQTIVSDHGFRSLGSQQAHQAKWKKSVSEVYTDATVSLDWTAALKQECKAAGITFFTSPYDFELVDAVDSFVPAFKIGSGDITWIEIIQHIARKKKPYILATGASTLAEVDRAVEAALEINTQLAILQCNTNYTASLENFRYIQLNVLRTYESRYPGMILGLSDHTPGHATVLGAVALGARIIEKHFTDDTSRTGPDHAFSMTPKSWREMVDRTRELERALGNGEKRVESNEEETVVVQRRSLRAARPLLAGQPISRSDLIPLRPCPTGALEPWQLESIIGLKLIQPISEGQHLTPQDLSA